MIQDRKDQQDLYMARVDYDRHDAGLTLMRGARSFFRNNGIEPRPLQFPLEATGTGLVGRDVGYIAGGVDIRLFPLTYSDGKNLDAVLLDIIGRRTGTLLAFSYFEQGITPPEILNPHRKISDVSLHRVMKKLGGIMSNETSPEARFDEFVPVSVKGGGVNTEFGNVYQRIWAKLVQLRERFRGDLYELLMIHNHRYSSGGLFYQSKAICLADIPSSNTVFRYAVSRLDKRGVFQDAPLTGVVRFLEGQHGYKGTDSSWFSASPHTLGAETILRLLKEGAEELEEGN